MSFASESGPDDSNLPPLNVVIPDDARELDRDVLAYRREVRARQRRERLTRLVRPVRALGFGGPVAIFPIIALCLAFSLIGGALLSVVTMSPASAPTLSGPAANHSGAPVLEFTTLPSGTVRIAGRAVPVRSLVTSVIAIIPSQCNCADGLQRLAEQAVAVHDTLYFAAAGPEAAKLDALTTDYGDGVAVAAADDQSTLSGTYNPIGLTVLLVFKDATAAIARDLTDNFQLTSVMSDLGRAGASFRASPSAAS